MATDQSTPRPDSSEPEQLRSQAKWRSHFWPGSGFALLGYSSLAGFGTASVVLMSATLVGLAFAFSPFFIWSFIASVVIYLCLYLAEQTMCRSITIHPGGQKRFLSKYFVLVCVAG